mgnify:CR=1 FL=1
MKGEAYTIFAGDQIEKFDLVVINSVVQYFPTEEYLAEVNRAYNHYFFHYTATPLLVVNTEGVDFARSEDDIAAGLGDPARLRLLGLIAAADGAEACVCDLTEPLGLSQPTVSHHLKVLTEAGFLSRTKRGTWAYYRLRPEALTGIARPDRSAEVDSCQSGGASIQSVWPTPART